MCECMQIPGKLANDDVLVAKKNLRKWHDKQTIEWLLMSTR